MFLVVLNTYLVLGVIERDLSLTVGFAFPIKQRSEGSLALQFVLGISQFLFIGNLFFKLYFVNLFFDFFIVLIQKLLINSHVHSLKDRHHFLYLITNIWIKFINAQVSTLRHSIYPNWRYLVLIWLKKIDFYVILEIGFYRFEKVLGLCLLWFLISC